MILLLFISLISTQCVPFTLQDTECSYLGKASYYNTFNVSQATIFNYIALQISDLRMIQPAECRRALVWYSCSLAFPSCTDTGPCSLDYSSCMAINEACTGLFNLTCPPNNCNLTTELHLDQSVPVLTCLDSNRTTIPCCPSPFAMDGECILKCGYNLPYFFPPGYGTVQKVCQILFYIIVWMGFIFMIYVYAPLVISFWKPFPQYLLPLALLFEYLYLQTLLWELYDEDYFCGNNMSLLTGVLQFMASYRCVFQAGFSFLFLFLSDCYTLILAISIFYVPYPYITLDMNNGWLIL
jgi:hypothetical protein